MIARTFPVLFSMVALGCATSPRPSDFRAELIHLGGELRDFSGIKVLALDLDATDPDQAVDIKKLILGSYQRAIPGEGREQGPNPVHVSVHYTADFTGCNAQPPARCPRTVSAQVEASDHTHSLAQVWWIDRRGGPADEAAARFVEVLVGLFRGTARIGYAAERP